MPNVVCNERNNIVRNAAVRKSGLMEDNVEAFTMAFTFPLLS